MKTKTQTRTPGPWVVHDDSNLVWPLVETEGGKHIVARWVMGRSRHQAEANARLIAAAPDLLAALKRANDMLDACDIDREVRLDMFAAIAKAVAI